MKAFMAQHRYSGRRSAGELLDRLRRAPTGLAGDSETDAKGELVRALATPWLLFRRKLPSSPRASNTPSLSCRMARSSCPSPVPADLRRPDPRRAGLLVTCVPKMTLRKARYFNRL